MLGWGGGVREMALALESVNEGRVDNHLVSLGTSEAGWLTAWLVYKHEHPFRLDMSIVGRI